MILADKIINLRKKERMVTGGACRKTRSDASVGFKI